MSSNLLCYCFGYSHEDIEHDVMAHAGTSTILERIMAEKKSGGCSCAKKHPLGR
ncbi:MAG TPA: hypothetical protein VLH56_07810 [Dissulfurispiraceae bacterium]|nr:hypothetical protein [Dissulfurispiraceae bacterium]